MHSRENFQSVGVAIHNNTVNISPGPVEIRLCVSDYRTNRGTWTMLIGRMHE
jgi:hypothetical protein